MTLSCGRSDGVSLNLVCDLGSQRSSVRPGAGMLGRAGPTALWCRHGCGSLPGAAWQLDHAWVSADCPPRVGGSVFEVRLLGPVRAIRLGREIALGGPRS